MRVWQSGPPPDPRLADADGLVALGGSLDPDLVLAAYRVGLFPWSSRPVVTWWSPDPRAIFDIENYEAHRSVRKTMERENWRYAIDENFAPVMAACAERTNARPSTWISPDFIATYSELHRRGDAHSFEVYEGKELVGGLYGIAIGGFFGGESMFHRKAGASKAAFTFLVEQLRACGYSLLDGQAPNPHLTNLGAIEIPREDYLARLATALTQKPRPLGV